MSGGGGACGAASWARHVLSGPQSAPDLLCAACVDASGPAGLAVLTHGQVSVVADTVGPPSLRAAVPAMDVCMDGFLTVPQLADRDWNLGYTVSVMFRTNGPVHRRMVLLTHGASP